MSKIGYVAFLVACMAIGVAVVSVFAVAEAGGRINDLEDRLELSEAVNGDLWDSQIGINEGFGDLWSIQLELNEANIEMWDIQQRINNLFR